MADDDLSATGLEGGGNMRLGRQFGEFKAGFKVDTAAIKNLDKSFKDLHGTLNKVKKELQDISALSKGLKVNLGGAGGAASGNATSAKVAQMSSSGGGAGDAVAASARNGIFQKIKGSISGAGGAEGAAGAAAGGAKAGIAGAIAGPLMAIAGAAGGALNERIARGYEYSLAADRMNLRIQQMTGMTALDVQEQYRQPLTNYRLGQGGINEVLALQRSTGLGNQGAAIEAFRTSSGFGYSTADVTRMLQTMASPQANNRMFLMTGMSMYGPGGVENQGMDVIQNAARRLNLTNPNVARGARQPGSNTRQMMEFMGIPVDMQEMILDYSEQNIAFQKKGGNGMYDPSNRQHQQMMGVTGSFALQREETERVKDVREENFYRRQVDNFADLEEKTQSLTKMFGQLEETLSGIIGQSISNKPYLSAAKGLLSSGLVSGGAAVAAMGGPAGWILGGSMMIGGLGLQMLGDPYDNPASANDNNLKIPTYGKPTTISGLETNSTFSKMHPKMKERLKKLFIASGGRVGFGGGTRDPAQQRQLFLSRYTPTTEKTGIEWDGKYWKKNPGVAAAAPPGRSMHEIGLAADLVGDMDWLARNAEKFGLKTFGAVNDEPWHVQPTELPNSRREYEKGGATWGTNGQFDENARFDGPGAPPPDGEHGSSSRGFAGGGAFGTTPVSGTMTINDAIELARADQMASFLAGGGGESSYSGGSYVPRGGTTTTKALAGKMSGKEIVSLMSSVGRWAGQDLVKAVGISYRESNWNPRVLNPNRNTKDKSYGLFQINMIDDLGPSRRKWFGIATDEQLYDPATNVRAARMMFDSRASTKGNGWYDWGPYKGVPETYKVDVAAAAQTVREAQMSGDPMDTPRAGRNSYGTSIYNEGSTISVPVNVYLQGSGYVQNDAHKIANEVARILEDKAQILSIRRS